MKRFAPSAAAEQPLIKKLRASIEWLGKQAPALAQMCDGDILLKEGSFGPRNREAFLNDWAKASTGPIYEVLMPDSPARLYLDVESVSPGPEPPQAETQAWLRGLIAVAVTGHLLRMRL
jgi:hypothetical protein